MHLLALSGSLRAGASNTALLEAARLAAPPGVTVELCTGIAALPAFNPDLDTPDGTGLPPQVEELRARIGRADGLLISCPEYAHGLPGAFKNALDWLVGSLEFPGKPVALLMASARATHARAQLVEILTTMSARIVDAASVTIEVPRSMTTGAQVMDDAELRAALQHALAAMVASVGPITLPPWATSPNSPSSH